ncbi:GntR domain protein [Treponema primitia ZAS-2]|uniref:GntR domain protein n=1 Tax=Treponema primitia (strain ATCC BAA-887 / DSM 12427 / ZAS-2) TaxID=545694 RepID=F5YNS9_TREPZ|nr:FCD domain-containing protein [Treponema primitia]AEF85669.1 GntR domain protein [Treponema primitia ZAS-2]
MKKNTEIGKSLGEQVSEDLIRYIIDNNLPRGAKLPNELELTRLLGVGRSTIREAVRSLVSRNVLEVRQGAGTFVAEHRLGVPDDPLGFTFIRDKEKLTMDLVEVRLSIEPRIAAMAARAASDEDIRELKALAREVEDLIHAGEDHSHKDVEFHTRIAQSSRNLVVPNLMPIIQQSIILFVNTTHRVLVKETIDTHRLIVDAIEEHDSIGASDAMTLHIIHNRNYLKTLFRE